MLGEAHPGRYAGRSSGGSSGPGRAGDSGVGLRGGNWEKVAGASQILGVEEGGLSYQPGKRRPSLRSQGAGRGVDGGGPGPGTELEGKRQGMEILGWRYCSYPTQSGPTLSPASLPCPHDTPQPQGPRWGGESDHLPLPQWGAMLASRPRHNSLSVGMSSSVQPVCVCVSVWRSV